MDELNTRELELERDASLREHDSATEREWDEQDKLAETLDEIQRNNDELAERQGLTRAEYQYNLITALSHLSAQAIEEALREVEPRRVELLKDALTEL